MARKGQELQQYEDMIKDPETAYIFCNEKGVPAHDIRKSFSTALEKSGIIDF